MPSIILLNGVPHRSSPQEVGGGSDLEALSTLWLCQPPLLCPQIHLLGEIKRKFGGTTSSMPYPGNLIQHMPRSLSLDILAQSNTTVNGTMCQEKEEHRDYVVSVSISTTGCQSLRMWDLTLIPKVKSRLAAGLHCRFLEFVMMSEMYKYFSGRITTEIIPCQNQK